MSTNARSQVTAHRLTVSILTRNGAERLPRLLAEVATFADEIVVGVDASSTDASEAVALEGADIVFRFDHQNELSAARMRIFEYATGDWIFVIDDDESLEPDFPAILRELMDVPLITHAWFPRRWIVQEDPPLYLSAELWFPDWQLRLFRNDRTLAWKPAQPHSGYRVMGPGHQETRAAILHYEPVWKTPEERAAKLRRYRAGGAVSFSEWQYAFPEDVLRLPCPHPRMSPGAAPARSEPGTLVSALPAPTDTPDALWAMDVVAVDCPVEARCNEPVSATVRVRNVGRIAWWPNWGIRGADLRFSHHVGTAKGESVFWDCERTLIPAPVPPGGEAVFYHTFRTPNVPGDYVIEWDMVNETVCWFEKPKSNPLGNWPLSVGQSIERFVGQADRLFLSDSVHPIPGWMGDYAALRTMELMRWQTAQGLSGPVLEIGVYAGRYFAVLRRECALAGDLAVGLDIFGRVSEVEVRANLQIQADDPGVIFLHGPSTDFSASDLLEALGAPPRFVSIDGSHLLDDVRHDLDLCDAVLADHGIVACDDFLNPVRLGVGQAIHEKILKGGNLVPFALVQNKLFLCRPGHHDVLFDLAARLARRDATGPVGECFARNEDIDPSRNASSLYGWTVVVMHDL